MNRKVLIFILLVFGLLLAALFARNGELVWMTLPILAYLGMGILQSLPAGNIRLSAARNVEKIATGGIASAEVRVTVSNQSAGLVHLQLSDPLQSGMRITAGQIRQSMMLRSGENSSLQYAFQSERGSFAWKTIRAAVRDPFGLIETVLELPAEAEVQIQPRLNKFRHFSVRPQHTLHSAGSIPARLGGSGTDFWGVREYHSGDPLRRLDWRRTARHPRRFFTKEFEQEEIADIGLILDARRKTDLRIGQDSLFEHSARAAASLAEVFLRQGNRVSLLVYREHVVNVFPGYGKGQLNRILRTLAQVTPEEAGSLNGLQLVPIHMFSSRSLIVIFSPLAPDDWRLFPRLRAYGYQVLLISPNPMDYAERILPNDSTTRLAGRLTRLERQLEIGKITQLWIPVIDWQVSQPLAPLIRNAFAHSHIQRKR
jgi:uncharacterized protein (DUF58 family)